MGDTITKTLTPFAFVPQSHREDIQENLISFEVPLSRGLFSPKTSPMLFIMYKVRGKIARSLPHTYWEGKLHFR